MNGLIYCGYIYMLSSKNAHQWQSKYVGSTIQSPNQRLARHKTQSTEAKYANYPLYKLAKTIGWNNITMCILEVINTNKTDLLKAETRWIRAMNSYVKTNPRGLNQNIPCRTSKEYYRECGLANKRKSRANIKSSRSYNCRYCNIIFSDYNSIHIHNGTNKHLKNFIAY